MTYFYIDTSSSYLYAGIVKDNQLITEIKNDYGSNLSKYAVNEIKNMFESINLKPLDIDKIIVVSGPGSFTGIRIGMTFSKIFAWSLEKEITTINSLDAMAYSISSRKVLVPIIDARRGYVYAGVYKDGDCILKNQYIELKQLQDYLEKLNESFFYITNDKKFDFENKFGYNPNILKIVEAFKNKKGINPHLVEPEYFKLTEAEENIGSSNHDN